MKIIEADRAETVLNVGTRTREDRHLVTSYTPSFLQQVFSVHSFQQVKNDVTLQLQQKKLGHRQIVDIQRPPRVALENKFSRQKRSAMDSVFRTY